MDVIFNIFNKVCVLVTAASALTLVPGFRRSERSLLSVPDRGTALLVFLILGLVEEAAVGQTGWFNHRIVAVCAAGLLAGPGVGAAVAAFMTWIAVTFHGRPLVICAVSMFSGGLIGGWLYRWRPKLAQHPLTGFCLTLAVSLLRNGLIFFYASGARMRMQMLRQMGIVPVLQGLFGRSFRLEVGSEVGRGTMVRMRIPLRRRFDIAEESLEARQF
jgi:LytS/YehU family sensor histidine kinase